MERKMNNTQNIVALKQKLASYKQTLETLKSGSAIDDYLQTKNEYDEIKKQVSNLEGELKTVKEKQDLYIEQYEQQVRKTSDQVESLNHSIGYLKQDVALLMSKINQINFNDLIKKIDTIVGMQQPMISSIKEEDNVIQDLKEEINQLKKYLNTNKQETSTNSHQNQIEKPSNPNEQATSANSHQNQIAKPFNPIKQATSTNSYQNQTAKPSSFGQLKNMLQSSNDFNPSPIGENLNRNQKFPLPNQYNRQGMPSLGHSSNHDRTPKKKSINKSMPPQQQFDYRRKNPLNGLISDTSQKASKSVDTNSQHNLNAFNKSSNHKIVEDHSNNKPSLDLNISQSIELESEQKLNMKNESDIESSVRPNIKDSEKKK